VHAREISEAVAQKLARRRDVVRPSRARMGGDRQTQDLDEERPLRADRPAAGPPAWWNVGP
jgi:hypothetical protein